MTDLQFAVVIWVAVAVLGVYLLRQERARIAPYIPHFVAGWKWSSGKRLPIIASVMGGAEAIVTSGIPLPGSDRIPAPARLAVIGSIVALSFYLRWRTGKEKNDGG
jgi:hypothetical protein